MIHKNFQAWCVQLHLYKMTRKVYHDVEWLFTNVLIESTISYYWLNLCSQKAEANFLKIDFQKIVGKTCCRMYFQTS